jgi:hypothetical protein
MQKIFTSLGRLGAMFVSKATQMPETAPRQRKLVLESIGLHLQQYPHYYAEFTAYRKSLWQNLKTGNITLREIGYVLQTSIMALGSFYLGQAIGRRNLLGYKGSEIEHSEEQEQHTGGETKGVEHKEGTH